MKFLIAGLGSIGRRHLRNLVALGQQDILLYRTHQSTMPEDEIAEFQVETDLDAALSHAPDAVIISNPTARHLDVAVPAAKAGCHLLIEKPVTTQWAHQVEILQRTIRARDLRVLVGFQFRFHPVLMGIMDLLHSGRMGQVYSFRVHWGEYLPGWHPWEDYRQSYAARRELGGGVVNTLCHPLDYVRWMFGEVVSLSAFTGQVSELTMDVEDVAEITLGFDQGCVGSVHLDYFQRPPAHWMAINCEKGTIYWDNEDGSAKIFHAEQKEWDTILPPAGFERNDLFLAEMAHFIDLVRGEAQSRCTLQDGLRALALMEAVHSSGSTGQRILF